MDKLQMVHEYAKIILEKVGVPKPHQLSEISAYIGEVANAVADSVIAQYEKKNPIVKDEGEWHPDWSQAPDWAKWYCVNKNMVGKWAERRPLVYNNSWRVPDGKISNSPMNNFDGNWLDSLRKRPK